VEMMAGFLEKRESLFFLLLALIFDTANTAKSANTATSVTPGEVAVMPAPSAKVHCA